MASYNFFIYKFVLSQLLDNFMNFDNYEMWQVLLLLIGRTIILMMQWLY